MSRAQAGVALGMAAALAVTIALVAYGLSGAAALVGPAPPTLQTRVDIAIEAALFPLICLAASIGAVASRRFFSAVDIDGDGLTDPTPGVRITRAILQNTAEQTLLAVPVYAGLALTGPASALGMPLVLSRSFVIGRVLFMAGYARGAAARSFGFALTFYPTVGALLVLAGRLTSL